MIPKPVTENVGSNFMLKKPNAHRGQGMLIPELSLEYDCASNFTGAATGTSTASPGTQAGHPVKLPKCGHIFCHRCVRKWFEPSLLLSEGNRRHCPMCRKRFFLIHTMSDGGEIFTEDSIVGLPSHLLHEWVCTF